MMNREEEKRKKIREITAHFDVVPGAVLVYADDEAQTIYYVNRKMVELFSCSDEEEFYDFVGKSFKGLVYPPDLEMVLSSIRTQQGYKENHFDFISYRIRTKEGKIRKVDDYGSREEDPVIGSYFVVFLILSTEHETSESQLDRYVQENIDRAIREGYIRAYYQPVVRTLTGRLCSVEALARWDDPKYGFLSPAVFVPALEERSLVYKLDNCIIEEAARMLRGRIDRGEPVVPVSVNFSRRDFQNSDPFRMMEEVVERYNLIRAHFCIEITESTAMEDPERIQEEIARFHEAGYEVWMDDFGSAYSSLNSLQNFAFDEIKLDMNFMRNLNERSRKIITSVIDMAKKLGIHTLAEGVETEEQLEFLREIGCEKIQGYYYGKPMPVEELVDHIEEKGIRPESRSMRYFYDEAGKINLITELPIALFIYRKDQNRFETLYLSSHYKKAVFTGYKNAEKSAQDFMNREDLAVYKRFRMMAEAALESGQQEVMDFVAQNRYYRFTMEKVVSTRDTTLFLTACYDITHAGGNGRPDEELDGILRNVITVFTNVYLLDFEYDSIEVILSDLPMEKVGKKYFGIRELERFQTMSQYVFPDDRERFLRACRKEYILKALSRTGRGVCTELFRIRNQNGDYEWTQFTVIPVVETDRKQYLLCLSPSALEDAPDPQDVAKAVLEDSEMFPEYPAADRWDSPANLWNTLAQQKNQCLFWKDRQGRFVGVTRAFLDYYGFHSADEVLGKTDSEMGWHFDDSPFRKAEERVLNQGETVVNSIGRTFSQGIPRRIAAWKYPVYKKGKIHGLLGRFIDVEELLPKRQSILDTAFRDPVTGFMTTRAFFLSSQKYEDNYRLHEEDYVVALLDIPEFFHLHNAFGRQVAEDLMRKAAAVIRHHYPSGVLLARIQESEFLICSKQPEIMNGMERSVLETAGEIRNITEVDGYPCTPYVSHGIARGSEVNSVVRLLEMVQTRGEQMDSRDWDVSGQEAYVRIYNLRKIFDFVRVVDPQRKKVYHIGQDGTRREDAETCYCLLGKYNHCTNCLSLHAMQVKKRLFKFEYAADDIYFMIARSIRIDNTPFALEIGMKLDQDSFSSGNREGHLIRELLKKNKELYLDALTGIYNRRYYDEQMKTSICQGVAFLDVDNFKQINDSYGHRAGDRALQKIAGAIKESVRGTDLTARYGGDEFVVCFEKIPEEIFTERLKKIYQKVAELQIAEGKDRLQVKISIGGCYGEDRVDRMLLQADKALYAAKREECGWKVVRSRKE